MHIYDSRGAAALIHKIDLQRISFLTIERVFAHQQTTVIRVILTNSDFLHVQTTRLLQAPWDPPANTIRLWKLKCVCHVSVEITEWSSCDSCPCVCWWTEYVHPRTCLPPAGRTHVAPSTHHPPTASRTFPCLWRDRAVPRWTHTLGKSLPIPPVPQQTLALKSRRWGGEGAAGSGQSPVNPARPAKTTASLLPERAPRLRCVRAAPPHTPCICARSGCVGCGRSFSGAS